MMFERRTQQRRCVIHFDYIRKNASRDTETALFSFIIQLDYFLFFAAFFFFGAAFFLTTFFLAFFFAAIKYILFNDRYFFIFDRSVSLLKEKHLLLVLLSFN